MVDNVYGQQKSLQLWQDIFKFDTALYQAFLSLNGNIGII